MRLLSSRFGWQERASAYDAEQDRLKTAEIQRVRTEGLAAEHNRIRELTAIFDALKPKIEAEIERAIGAGVDDMYQLQQLIRRVVGKWVSDTHRRRPMIIPVVVES